MSKTTKEDILIVDYIYLRDGFDVYDIDWTEHVD